MRANRFISGFTKFPLTHVFVIGFTLALVGVAARTIYVFPLEDHCVYPQSYYDIRSDRDVVLARGIYYSYRNKINKAHLTYVGTLTHYSDGQQVSFPVPIQRSLWFTEEFDYNLLRISVGQQSKGLGDRSEDKDVDSYVFSQFKPNMINTLALYLLDGKVLATGTENAARSVCIN